MNLYNLFSTINPPSPLLIGTVQSISANGSSEILLLSGIIMTARGTGVSIGSKVFVKNGLIEGQAPNLTVVNILV